MYGKSYASKVVLLYLDPGGWSAEAYVRNNILVAATVVGYLPDLARIYLYALTPLIWIQL